MRKFVAPEFIFGVGARYRAGFCARNLGAQRVLVVTDKGVIASGWLQGVLDSLDKEGIRVCIFSDVTPNPKDHEIQAGVDAYRQNNCDILLALGGGSVIDCAKGIGIVVANGGNILDFEGVDAIPIPGPPLICIPTTAGSSADISQFAIVMDTVARKKIAIISKTVVPDLALVDPETTLTVPAYLTACTGLDALTHAIEAYVSTANSPVVDGHALSAVKGIRENLLKAIAEPDDLTTREKLALASLEAGLAFSNASLGATHAMAHSVGGYLDLPHGESNALLLEFVTDFNFETAPERYERIGQAMGLDFRGRTPSQKRALLVEEIRDFRHSAGVVGSLSARGVGFSDTADLARHAVRDACIFTNPRRVSLADVRAIYAQSL